ncbi:MAG: asparagine synthase-related protein [Acidobacteriota bacterium]
MTGFAVGAVWRPRCVRAVVDAAASAFDPWPTPTHEDLGGAHALVAEAALEIEPERLWIVGEARLDGVPVAERSGRPALERFAAACRRRGRRDPEETLLGLEGDYSAVLWDRRRRRLIGLRDYFGVRPLYYYRGADMVWLSNLPAALLAIAEADLRTAPALRPEGVFDRLLFGRPLDPGVTVWRDVGRVPPGSQLFFEAEKRGGRPREPLAVERAADLDEGAVVERLRGALDAAVRDRLDGDRASLWMSGGLDSTSVAASVRAVGARATAHTVTYERLIDDREGDMAALAARHLGLVHRRHAVDRYRLFERWRDLPATALPAEPEHDAMYVDIDRRCLEESPVALTGFGADPLLLPERSELGSELASGRLGALWRTWRAFRSVGRRPPLGLASAWAKRRIRRAGWRPPPWLRPDFDRRVGGDARWRRFTGEAISPPAGPRREALHHTVSGGWAELFEQLDAGVRGVPIVRRHPFFDRRVVEVLLGLPSLPWCVDKWALRLAQRGRLPDAVRRREKSPLAGDPWPGVATPLHALWSECLRSAPELAEFIDPSAIDRVLGGGGADRAAWRAVAPALSFAVWKARWLSR